MPALDVEPDRDPCSPLIEGNMSVDLSPYAQYISGALLLVLGVFTTKKV